LFISGAAGQGGILVLRTYLESSGTGGQVTEAPHALQEESWNPSWDFMPRSIRYARRNPRKKGTINGFKLERRIHPLYGDMGK
jgi:hypothetical protein